MTNPTETGQRPIKRLFAAGIAGAVAALAAVYVIVGPDGNSVDAQSCSLALETAAKVRPFATGEVAAFLPAQNPLPLSTLSFRKPDDTPVALSDFKGKTVLLNLWATWCAPCRKEMPALDRLQALRVDFVKITDNTLTPELFLYAVREAKKRGMKMLCARLPVI